MDCKNRSIVYISVSDSDRLWGLINVSYNVGYLYFVLGISLEDSANERLQMVFTNGRNKTIVPWNMVLELDGICVNVSQKCCVHPVGYVKQGVGVRSSDGTGFSSDKFHNVKSCLQVA